MNEPAGTAVADPTVQKTLARAVVKKDTLITIGWPGNVVVQILSGDFVGGLFLVERNRFAEVKKEMEKERS